MPARASALRRPKARALKTAPLRRLCWCGMCVLQTKDDGEEGVANKMRAGGAGSVLRDFLDGLKVAQLVRDVKPLKDERERRVPPAHALDRSLQPQEAVIRMQTHVSYRVSPIGRGRGSHVECGSRTYQRSWIVLAISAAKPPVSGASWLTISRPVLFTDCPPDPRKTHPDE